MLALFARRARAEPHEDRDQADRIDGDEDGNESVEEEFLIIRRS